MTASFRFLLTHLLGYRANDNNDIVSSTVDIRVILFKFLHLKMPLKTYYKLAAIII